MSPYELMNKEGDLMVDMKFPIDCCFKIFLFFQGGNILFIGHKTDHCLALQVTPSDALLNFLQIEFVKVVNVR